MSTDSENMLSVIIPARNEQYLEKTIRNVLENARGNIEVIAILDGYLPDPKIDIGDDRAVFYHFETSIGQRQATNYGARVCKGNYVMKLDAHCAVAEGFDVQLIKDYQPDWTVVPRMYNLDVETWTPKLHKRTDYMYFSSPDDKEKPFRAQYYGSRQPKGPDIDDTACCMGPGFFMSKDRYWELGGMDEGHGGWGQMGIEVALKAWLSGGSFKVNKNTWFAHWFRGGGGPGFPYQISGRDQEVARKYSQDLWLNDKWPQATRKLAWVINKFNPPGWENWKGRTEGMSYNEYTKEQAKMNERSRADERAKADRLIRNTFGVLVREDFSPIGTKPGTHREQLIPIWNQMGYKVGAEIGVYRGYFSHAILSGVKGCTLHCIDPWVFYEQHKTSPAEHDRNYQKAMETLKPFIDEGRCIVHKQKSEEVYAEFEDGSLDFLHIDGAHDFDNCALDLIHWVPKVRVGGMVAVHDYTPMRRGGVIEAVDGYTKCNLISPWFVIREAIPNAFWYKAR